MARDELIPWSEATAAELQKTGPTSERTLKRRAAIMLKTARTRAPRRTGELVRSMRTRLTTGKRTSAVLQLPAKYTAHEFGGEISPKGRFLAVPVSRAQRSLPGPRSDGPLFVLRARDGRRFLARRGPGGLVLRWRLVRQVRIKGRRFVSRAMAEASAAFPGEVLDELERGVLNA